MVEPRLSFDESQEDVYGEWMLDARHITNELINQLKSSKIQFKSIKHIEENARHKRDSEFSLENLLIKINKTAKYSKLTPVVINEENLVNDYYSVEQIFKWMENITKKNPNTIEILEIGQSIMNHSLKVLKVIFQ